MNKQTHKKLLDAVHNIQADRHKLVILIGSFGSGKTAMLNQILQQENAVYLDLNLELTDRLLGNGDKPAEPISNYNDGVTVHRLIDELCDEKAPNGETLIVDNVEILFSPELGKINPIDTFKRVSRQRPIILSLPVHRQGNSVVYSTPDNLDYSAMALEEYVVIDLGEI